MTKTLADYIPMLESIQSDPENVLDPDYVNARITYKNRDLMLMLDSAGVNLELTAPKNYRFSVSDLAVQTAERLGLTDVDGYRTYEIPYDKLDAHLNGSPLREYRYSLWVTCPPEEPERIKEILDDMIAKTPMVKKSNYQNLHGYAGVTSDGQPYFEAILGATDMDDNQLVCITNDQIDVYFPYFIPEALDDLGQGVENLIKGTEASVHITDYIKQNGDKHQDFLAHMSYEKGCFHMTIPTNGMFEQSRNAVVGELKELLTRHRQHLINDFYLQSGLVKYEDFMDQVEIVDNRSFCTVVKGSLQGQPTVFTFYHNDDRVMMHIDPKEGSPVDITVYSAQNAKEAEMKIEAGTGSSSFLTLGALSDLGHLKVGKDLCQHYVDIALNGLENYKASDAGKEDAAKNFAKDLGLDLSDLDLLTSGCQLEQ